MDDNSILNKYHINSNKLVSKSLRFIFYIYTFIFILSLSHIFKSNTTLNVLCYILSFTLLLFPTLLVNVFNKNNTWVKYVNISISIIF